MRLLDQLKQQGFLSLTKSHPEAMNQACGEQLQQGVKYQLLDTGVLKFEPQAPCDYDLVVSSGVHGNETAPIEIIDTLVQAILSGEITVRCRLLLIIGNPPAMLQSKRFVDENMNRLFNGLHKGKQHPEAERAARLESYMRDFFIQGGEQKQRLHYDLHTAIRGSKYKKFAIYPYSDGRPWNKQQLRWLKASGIEAVLLGHQPSGTFSYFSSHRFGADAFTLELGQVKPFGANDLTEFKAITANLSALITALPIDLPEYSGSCLKLFQVKHELIKQSEQFTLNIDDDVKNFTDFSAGFQLTQDIDGGYKVRESGAAIVFANARVPIGQRAGLVMSETQL